MNFKRKIRRVSRRQLRRDIISREEYDHIQAGLADEEVADEWERRVRTQLKAPWGPEVASPDWAGIWAWLIANWADILRVLLALLPLVLLADKPVLKSDLEKEELTDEN